MRSFRRHIMSFEIDPTDVGDSATGTRVYVLNIRGTAFLWHQVSERAPGRGSNVGTGHLRWGGHLTVATDPPYTLFCWGRCTLQWEVFVVSSIHLFSISHLSPLHRSGVWPRSC